MTSPITDGVFAMYKPQSKSSAQVLRDLQDRFIPSKYFEAALAAETARRDEESNRQKRRRRDKTLRVKLGHGGTLDPLATGILICGVGRGTKDLPSFLGCKKTYETVVLFGAATDSYDSEGKVVARAPYQHLTRDAAETAIMEKFIGEIKQTPPIFSALRINGKHAYEYAREGKELPRELEARDMKIDECKILEWYEPGQHSYSWPKEDAPAEEIEAMKKVLPQVTENESTAVGERGLKRAAPEEDHIQGGDEESHNSLGEPGVKKQKTSSPEPPLTEEDSSAAVDQATSEIRPSATSGSDDKGPPAAKVRLTVSSGFYVRSFCHDLGLELGSMGLMAALVRSKQGDFDLGETDNVLNYADIEQDESVWSAKLQRLLQRWPSIRQKMVDDKAIDIGNGEAEQADLRPVNRVSYGERDRGAQRSPRPQHWKQKHDPDNRKRRERSGQQSRDGRRQNTSSPEP